MAAYIRMKTANTNYKIVVVFLLLVRNDGAVEKAFACYQLPRILNSKAKRLWLLFSLTLGRAKSKRTKMNMNSFPFDG